ncbi:MAG: NAD(P)H:quinone oxidoreductase [Thermaerobacter sp.]|nr:NAD(P)H:quinone oxidoreductase [Thermaerobacter sp.]
MDSINLAVIYYSATGTNYQMAHSAAEAGQAAGAAVRLLKVPELAPASAIAGNPAWQAHVEATKHISAATVEDIEWADALIFCAPTRFGNMAGQMKQFLDTMGGPWAAGKTVNKVVSAATSAQNPHGGQEAAILSLYTSMYHWGAIVVAPGYTDPVVFGAGGNPYGTSVSALRDGTIAEAAVLAVQHQARRVVTVAKWLKAGQRA